MFQTSNQKKKKNQFKQNNWNSYSLFSPSSPFNNWKLLTENPTHHESLTRSDMSLLMLLSGVDNGVPDIKALKSARASFGLCKATSCPDPLTITKFRPAYCWLHPTTCFKSWLKFQKGFLTMSRQWILTFLSWVCLLITCPSMYQGP